MVVVPRIRLHIAVRHSNRDRRGLCGPEGRYLNISSRPSLVEHVEELPTGKGLAFLRTQEDWGRC